VLTVVVAAIIVARARLIAAFVALTHTVVHVERTEQPAQQAS
jgi:hypothetical protein